MLITTVSLLAFVGLALAQAFDCENPNPGRCTNANHGCCKECINAVIEVRIGAPQAAFSPRFFSPAPPLCLFSALVSCIFFLIFFLLLFFRRVRVAGSSHHRQMGGRF